MTDREPDIRVTFLPGGKETAVPPGTTLLTAARRAGVELEADCDGKGQCGKCRVIVRSGEVRSSVSFNVDDEAGDRIALACRTVPLTDVSVFVPEPDIAADIQRLSSLAAGEAAEQTRKLELDPLACRLCVTLEATSVTEGASDQHRLSVALGEELEDGPFAFELAALRKLGPAAMADQGRLTATLAWYGQQWHVTDVTAGHTDGPQVGVAVDIGTSTVVVHLVDLATGRTIGSDATYNSQAAYGADYITRIMALGETTTLRQMHELVVGDINDLVGTLTDSQTLKPSDVMAVVVAGNTPMIHFLLALDPTMIRKEPYVSVSRTPPPVRAADVGVKIAEYAMLYPMPGTAAFVGSDISAGILTTGLHARQGMAMLIDIGTNGEIVLGNRDWMACASSSAGTAFEGTRFGMRGVEGAIERIRIDEKGELVLGVIGEAKPKGLCGSGVLDLIAELFRTGVLGRDGKLADESSHKDLRRGEDELEFVIAAEDEAADGQPIYITQSEITNVIRSKAGVAAAITILLDLFEVSDNDLEAIYIAGSFGNFIDVGHAIRIGLLPDVPIDRVHYVGNTSLRGAKRVLRSRAELTQIHKLAGAMTYVDLMINSGYMDEFVQANFLPHTDPARYPSVSAARMN